VLDCTIVYIIALRVYEGKNVRTVYGIVKEGESWRIRKKNNREIKDVLGGANIVKL
jgi:hypothetical protein